MTANSSVLVFRSVSALVYALDVAHVSTFYETGAVLVGMLATL